MGDNKEKPKTCVKCFHVAEEKDKYCVRCGTPLVNLCTKEDSPNHKGCQAKNRPDAAFCAKCGSPTVYGEMGLTN